MINGSVVPISPRSPFANNQIEVFSTGPASINKLRIVDEWVILDSKKVLWLPPEYRPGLWTSHGNVLVIGNGTGRITFISRVI